MNLRGTFTTDAAGHIAFAPSSPRVIRCRSTGRWAICCSAQGRHNMRPAHLHFMIHKDGYKTQFSQVYSSDDPNLETDSQFGVTQALIAHYVLHDTRHRRRPGAPT